MNAEQKDLRLEFTAFELEDSVNCTADYVVIRDGKDKSAPLIGNKRFKQHYLEFLCMKFSNVPL